MISISSLLVAWLMGVLSGLISSVPVGPINVTILNEGARRGFWWAVLIGLGSVVMELIYCGIGFAGFSGLFESPFMRGLLELSSCLLMLGLGTKYLLARSEQEGKGSRLERRFHPHAAFMIGFLRVLGNPGVLLYWIAMSATLVSHSWVEANPISKMACVAGVGMGALGWFVGLSYFVSHNFHRKDPASLVRLSQVSGAGLLVVGVLMGSRLMRLLVAH